MQTIDPHQICPHGVSKSELYFTHFWRNYIIEIRKYMDKNHIHLSDCIEEIKQKKSKLSSKARQMLTIFDTNMLNEMLFKE